MTRKARGAACQPSTRVSIRLPTSHRSSALWWLADEQPQPVFVTDLEKEKEIVIAVANDEPWQTRSLTLSLTLA
ncbi:hypothetical protein CDL15_Pgr021205 [Punica granatum]|uniref:Uncharacterized protein n=1 Tax=Punica granatum TaxID=22663 RepID=A0A218WW82_PUNGR|nr:hypothetical protein CDL15_Pgr021205 [Punica granatum]